MKGMGEPSPLIARIQQGNAAPVFVSVTQKSTGHVADSGRVKQVMSQIAASSLTELGTGIQSINNLEINGDDVEYDVNIEGGEKRHVHLNAPSTGTGEGEKAQFKVQIITKESIPALAKDAVVDTSPDKKVGMELIRRLHKKVVKDWDPKNPVAATLVKYVAAPAIALYRYLTLGADKIHADKSKSSLNKLVDAMNPSTPKAFRQLLKRSAVILRERVWKGML